MLLVRLDKNIPECWSLYPTFEQRIVTFAERYTKCVPIDLLRETNQRRWVTTPLACGYWLFLEKGGIAVGHLLSYVAGDEFGRPFVEFYQLECDSGYSMISILPKLGRDFMDWIHSVNQAYERQGNPYRVTHGFLSTWHERAAYARFINISGLKFTEQRRVLVTAFDSYTDKTEHSVELESTSNEGIAEPKH